jgi:hypothetical protein
LQKLKEFTGMNYSQILEVATKVFANQDQEVDRKMKRKLDLFAEHLLESQVRHTLLIQTEA